MSQRFRLVLGCLFFLLLLIQTGASAYSDIYTMVLTSLRGWGAEWRDGRVVVTRVATDGPAATSLRVGDEIMALKAARPEVMPVVSRERWRVRAKTRYTLVVRRDGQTQEVALSTTGPELSQVPFRMAIYPVKLLFLVIGLGVFLIKPGDRQAWLLAIVLGGVAGTIRVPTDGLPLLIKQIEMVALVAAFWSVPTFMHFFLIFPARSPLLRRFPRLESRLYWPFYLLVLPKFGVGTLAEVFPLGAAVAWLVRQNWLTQAARIVALGYLVGGLAALAIGYRASDAVARRKLRVVAAGSVVGFFNIFLMPAGVWTGLAQRLPTIWGWIDTALLFTLPLIPLSFAYAIVRHQVIPVSLIIRRGVRYVLVSRGSLLLEALVVWAALTVLLTTIFNWLRPSGLVIGLTSAVVGIAAYNASRAVHQRLLAPVIDRHFFRQAYDAQQIITELAESLRTTASLPRLLELVATKIQTALQTENVAILVRDEVSGDYLSAYLCEYSPADGHPMARVRECRLPRHAEVVGRLSETGRPIEVDWRDQSSPPSAPRNGNDGEVWAEREALRELKSALLLPLATQDEMLGIISLGPRLGDLPYSREDERLLMSVAGPATLAIENARLVEWMVEEARRRQELEAENEQRAKELEEARQLQLSMLPRQVPQLPHLEVAVYMKPAAEVGGDYYDFHLGEDGTLTIAIGDATGHGLKAGTMVTATKALFKHLSHHNGIVDIFHQSSRALKLMNLRALYMAMTIVKVKDHRLTLSAAGMPPVLIYRARTRTVEEVMLRGMPLGSVAHYPYRQQETGLGCGDVVVLMSDGFPERFNALGEMLDYAKAREVLAEAARLSPREIIERFVDVSETWAGDRPQEDDITFVVLKAK